MPRANTVAIAKQRLPVEREVSFGGRDHAEIIADFIERAKLTIGDADYLWFVQALDLEAVTGLS